MLGPGWNKALNGSTTKMRSFKKCLFLKEKTFKYLSLRFILHLVPVTDASQGWKAIFSKDGGWLAAAKAINAIGLECKRKGVNFAFGRAGTFKKPLLALDGKTCIGVETADGTHYHADKVVLAAGAWSPALVDLEDQCCSKVYPPSCATNIIRYSYQSSGLGLCHDATHTHRSPSL